MSEKTQTEHTFPHQAEQGNAQVTDTMLEAHRASNTELYDGPLGLHVQNYLDRQKQRHESSGEIATGDTVTAMVLDAVGDMEVDIASRIGESPGSPDSVAATDYVSIAELEQSIDGGTPLTTEASLTPFIEAASESTGSRVSSGENPVQTLEHDGRHQVVTESIQMLYEMDAHLPGGQSVAEVLAHELEKKHDTANNAVVKESKIDHQMTKELRQKANLPADMKYSFVKDTLDVAQEDKAMLTSREHDGMHDARKILQERTFGKEAVEALKQDTIEQFDKSFEQRKGQTIIDEYSGRERRPIMDIQLEGHSSELVAAEIAKRSKGLDEAIVAITQMASKPEYRKAYEHDANKLDRYKDVLYDLGVWNRSHGQLLNDGKSVTYRDLESSGGTVADLYLDDVDIAKYREIDAIINEANGMEVDSVSMLADGIANLAAHTFPSGVELIHALPPDSFEAVVRQGAIAPRSQVLHGVKRTTQLNGGFTHMTMPGSAAYEYTHGSATLVGIPIDTVIEKSPYMHLEHDYVGNSFRKKGDEHDSSTQYEMGKMVINDIATAPKVFQSALHTMHSNLEGGVRASDIAQGKLNNLSFAASNNVETAAAYSYPIDELSIYTEDVSLIRSTVQKFPEKASMLYERSTVVDGGSGERPISAISLPSFNIQANAPITVFSPMSAKEVSFTEGDVGNAFNQSSVEVSTDTIVPGTEAKFMDQLLESGMRPHEVVAKALDAVNEKGGYANDLFKSFVRNEEVYRIAGISAASLVESLSSAQLDGINTLNKDYPWTDVAFVSSYANRLYRENATAFAHEASALQEYGYVLTDEQMAAVALYRQELDRQASEWSGEIPGSGMRF